MLRTHFENRRSCPHPLLPFQILPHFELSPKRRHRAITSDSQRFLFLSVSDSALRLVDGAYSKVHQELAGGCAGVSVMLEPPLIGQPGL
jgi:hypothetical protein